MFYSELDPTTRKWMLIEFDHEEASGNPYRSKWFSAEGRMVFPSEMRRAINEGNERTLAIALNNPSFWLSSYISSSGRRMTLPTGTSKMVAMNEFNEWYTHGFARRLIEEGVETCVIYRAEAAEVPRCECSALEGKIVTVRDVYDGHRARYHPEPGDPHAFSIPSGPNCHHSIRRPNK